MLWPVCVQVELGNIYLKLSCSATSGTGTSWRNVKCAILLERIEANHIQSRNLRHFDDQYLARGRCAVALSYVIAGQRIGIDKTCCSRRYATRRENGNQPA